MPCSANSAAPPEVPGYEVLGEVGCGGMGVVYKARQTQLDRLVALKVHRATRPGEWEREQELRRRFRTEAEALARLQHANIVLIYEVGEAGGRLYFSMEWVEGGSLARAVGSGQWAVGSKEGPRRAAQLVETLARAVHAAHQAGVLHRDLKAANVLLGADGTPKIADFGLAKFLDGDAAQTGARAVLGTPANMAPEQAAGEETGPGTDVFGLGTILYQLLTGKPPYEGTTSSETIRKAREGNPVRPGALNRQVPAALDRICRRALRAEPRERYPTAAALADDLRRYLDRPRRLRRWLAVGAAALLALAGVALVLLPPRAASWMRPAVAPTLAPAPPPKNGSPEAVAPGHPLPPTPAAPPLLKGFIDVVLYKGDIPPRQKVRLNDPAALPLKSGAPFCIEVELNRPVYLYVLWIDRDGAMQPVYPWQSTNWEARPKEEKPVDKLRCPDALPECYKLPPGPPGMVTLLLLARETPLPSEVDLRGELKPLPAQMQQDVRAAVWFENGEEVRDELGRQALRFDAKRRDVPVLEAEEERNEPGRRTTRLIVTKLDDPVLEVQERVRSRLLGRHFSYARAVSFACQGQ
jgi:tRNA A-37 threonylcarbamoyl transferase component Bud32